MASPEPATPFDGFKLPDEIALSSPAPAPGDAEPETIVDCIRRFILVQARLKAIEAEEKVLAREESDLSARVIEMMIEQGMDSPPGVDGMTAYLSPVHYVKKKIDPETGEEFTAEQIRAALRLSGLGAMISESYHGGQLRSVLKEYVEHGEVPEVLATVVQLEKRRELRVTQMAAGKRKAAPTS